MLNHAWELTDKLKEASPHAHSWNHAAGEVQQGQSS